jgi:hypothetical protein
MTDDLLKRATNALRQETGEPELRSGLTRARMLDSAAKAQRTRGNPLRWIVPFMLTLGAGTALAHVTHQYFPEVWNAVVPEALKRSVPEDEVVRRATKPKKKPEPVAITAPTPVAPAPGPVLEASVPPEPVAVREPEAQHPRAKRAHAPAVATQETPATTETDAPVVTIKPATTEKPAPAESAELTLFRRAMKLHSAKDSGAIAAWDAFLRVAPKSALATEARYNRALCLVRLGRSDDARKALAPFARGDMDNYRQREAAELIDALNDRDAGVRAH